MTETTAVTTAADTPSLRREIITACQALSAEGMVIGTWGNVSVRVEQGLLVTPSRVDYATMEADDLVVVSWEGGKISGTRPPSSEMELHRLLLLHRPDLGAIVHTHSRYASALACAQRSLPVCIEDMAQIIGAEVRCSKYAPGGRHRGLAEAARDAMGTEAAAVLLANHGPVAGGRNLAEAVVAARVLEKAAFVYVTATLLGGCSLIPEAEVSEERHRFLYKYGREDIPTVEGSGE